jgi:hypothetical protein
MQSIYDALAKAGTPGYDAALTSGVAAGGAAGSSLANPSLWEQIVNQAGNAGSSILKSLLPGNGNGSGETFGISNEILKGLLGAGIGAYGSDKMADAISGIGNQQNALAQKYLDMGAPYRSLLQQSYQPGFDLMSQPGYGDAFNRMAEISTNSWSPKGNPANSPGIQAGILNDVWAQNYLPALSNHRGQLGQFGGMGVNTSASMFGNAANAGMNAANADMGGIRALGYGLSSLFPTSSPQDDYLKQLTERTRQQNEEYRVKVGGKLWQ